MVLLVACSFGLPPSPAGAQRAPQSPRGDTAPLSLFPVRTVWTLALNTLLSFAPAYENGRVFFPLAGDRIAAYDVASGARRWLVSARPQMAPATGGGLLYFVEPDSLTALRADDGGVAWQLPFAEPLAVPPVWDNGWLVAATRTGSVLALRATDGELIWRRDLGSPAHARAALAADRVYVPVEDGRVIALRVENGEPVWERRLGGAPAEILALTDRVYVGAHDDYFYCLMAKDGRIDWRWRTGGDVVGVPVVDERRVYFVALDNVLRALDRESGGQKWMRPLPLRPTTGAVRVGSSLIVTGFAPTLRGFNIADGAAAGDITATPEVAAPPLVVDNPTRREPMLIFVTRDVAAGATATLVTRSFEPETTPVSPLPNLVTFTPQTQAPAR